MAEPLKTIEEIREKYADKEKPVYPDLLIEAVYGKGSIEDNFELQRFCKEYREGTLAPERKEAFDNMISDLDKHNVLTLRFKEGFTLADAGACIPSYLDEAKGVSGERVRGLEAKALRSLRHPSRSNLIVTNNGFISSEAYQRKNAYIASGLFQSNIPNDGKIYLDVSPEQQNDVATFLKNNCSGHYTLGQEADFAESVECIAVDNTLDYNAIRDFLAAKSITAYDTKDCNSSTAQPTQDRVFEGVYKAPDNSIVVVTGSHDGKDTFGTICKANSDIAGAPYTFRTFRVEHGEVQCEKMQSNTLEGLSALRPMSQAEHTELAQTFQNLEADFKNRVKKDAADFPVSSFTNYVILNQAVMQSGNDCYRQTTFNSKGITTLDKLKEQVRKETEPSKDSEIKPRTTRNATKRSKSVHSSKPRSFNYISKHIFAELTAEQVEDVKHHLERNHTSPKCTIRHGDGVKVPTSVYLISVNNESDHQMIRDYMQSKNIKTFDVLQDCLNVTAKKEVFAKLTDEQYNNMSDFVKALGNGCSIETDDAGTPRQVDVIITKGVDSFDKMMKYAQCNDIKIFTTAENCLEHHHGGKDGMD